MWTLGYSLISNKKLHNISISQIFTPPVVGMLSGLIVGIIPFLKNNICQNTGLINPLFKAVEIIAQGTIPCALIILGGNFAGSKIGRPESFRPILSAAAIKLFLLPLLAIIYVKFLFNTELLDKSLLIALVLVIEAAVPPANNLVVICTLEKNHENNMTGILFWNYLISIVSMTFYIMLALWIFQ
jgi:predicted permease